MSEPFPDNFHSINQENTANVVLIWFLPMVNISDEIKETTEDLRSVNSCVLIHDNMNSCIETMTSAKPIKKNVLIISGNDAYLQLADIDKPSLLDSVFIYPDDRDQYIDLCRKFPGKIHICTTRDELKLSVKETIADVKNQMDMFSFYDQYQQSTRDLSEQSAKFLWFQLFHDIILHLPRDDKAKEEMILACRQYYCDNQKTLEMIDNFNQNYQIQRCIEWYTKDTFLYRMINKALRTEDIDQLYLFRYYIADLSKQLTQEYENLQRRFENIIHLYRGMIIPREEVERLKKNDGRLIAVNGYWSTSRDQLCALQYIDGHTNDGKTIAVLFEIQCNLHDGNSPVIFADISHLSCISDEEEVLFDIGAVFQIDEISEEKRENTDILRVAMRTSGQGREILEQYKQENRAKMKDESPTIMLCTLLKRMGKVEKSLRILERLLKKPGDENLAHIHLGIGIARRTTKEYALALKHVEKACELTASAGVSHQKYAAVVLYNKGRVLDKMRLSEEAINVTEKAIKIVKEEIGAENELTAKLHSSIGRIYHHQQDFDRALQHHRTALRIRQTRLSPEHVVTAFSHADIGNTYLHQNKFSLALESHHKALEIRQKYLPSDHHSVAWSHHQLGKIYQNRHNSQEALKHYQHCLNIREKSVSTLTKHSVLDVLNNMISIYGVTSRDALSYRLKALKIQKTIEPMNYSTLADDLDKIARQCKSVENLDLSLELYKEAVKIREKYLSDDHSNLTYSHYGLASVYELRGENAPALEHYRKGLDVYKSSRQYSANDYLSRRSEENITRIQQVLK